MKYLRFDILFYCLFISVVLLAGCDIANITLDPDNEPLDATAVEKIRISALTEFIWPPDKPGLHLKASTELLNGAGNSIRKDCVWRFELYEFVPRSSEIRGIRLVHWPDMDLSLPGSDESSWKDFLQGYEFYLPVEFEIQPGKKYVLEATAMTDDRRYNDLYKIQYLP